PAKGGGGGRLGPALAAPYPVTPARGLPEAHGDVAALNGRGKGLPERYRRVARVPARGGPLFPARGRSRHRHLRAGRGRLLGPAARLPSGPVRPLLPTRRPALPP